jgi:hypothetical protein
MAAINKPIEAVMAAGHRRQSANATIVSSPQFLVVGHARARRRRGDRHRFSFSAPAWPGHVNGII